MGPIPISVGHSASLRTVRMHIGQKNEKSKIKIIIKLMWRRSLARFIES